MSHSMPKAPGGRRRGLRRETEEMRQRAQAILRAQPIRRLRQSSSRSGGPSSSAAGPNSTDQPVGDGIHQIEVHLAGQLFARIGSQRLAAPHALLLPL